MTNMTDLSLSSTLDVTGAVTFGSTVAYSGATTFSAAVTVGVDGTGYDVKAFGDTASKYMVWDQSADTLKLTDSTPLQLGGDEATADGFQLSFDGTATLAIDALTANDGIVVGGTTSTDFTLTSASGTVALDASGDTLTLAAVSLVTNTAIDCNANLDLDLALTAAGDGANVAVTINHATAAAEGLDVSIAQITTNRTSGRVAGIKSTVTSLAGDTAGVDYAAFEARVTAGEAGADHTVIYTEDAFDFFAMFLASGDGGATVSADGMTADPETATEAGYISIDIAGTGYQIPIYAA